MTRQTTAEVRVINAMTVQPFAAGPLAEPRRVTLHEDLHNGRIYANPRPRWQASETACVWGFELQGAGRRYPVSLPAARTILPGQSVEFKEVRIGPGRD